MLLRLYYDVFLDGFFQWFMNEYDCILDHLYPGPRRSIPTKDRNLPTICHASHAYSDLIGE